MGHFDCRNSNNYQGGTRMKISLKIVAFLLLVSITVGAFSGCAQIFYGAKIIDGRAENLINENFYAENKLFHGVSPRTRSFIIKSQDEYDAIFSEEANYDVDFSKKMLVVLTFITVYALTAEIRGMSLNDETLFVTINLKSPHLWPFNWGGSGPPYQRYVVLEMNDKDVSNIEFEVKVAGF